MIIRCNSCLIMFEGSKEDLILELCPRCAESMDNYIQKENFLGGGSND